MYQCIVQSSVTSKTTHYHSHIDTSLFFLCCFYYLLKVHVNLYVSTFVLSKLYSTFVHTTFTPSEIYNGQPEFPCALFLQVNHKNFCRKFVDLLLFFDNNAYAFT